jgi:ABC-2 type transport system permease protein
LAGVATFVCSLARTERQADSVTAATAFVLALLGGNFVGPNLPPVLRTLSLATPNGWALRAFVDLNTDGAGLTDIAPTLAVLIGMGLVLGALGVAGVRRVMTP